jgi:hypothetical protein
MSDPQRKGERRRRGLPHPHHIFFPPTACIVKNVIQSAELTIKLAVQLQLCQNSRPWQTLLSFHHSKKYTPLAISSSCCKLVKRLIRADALQFLWPLCSVLSQPVHLNFTTCFIPSPPPSCCPPPSVI